MRKSSGIPLVCVISNDINDVRKFANDRNFDFRYVIMIDRIDKIKGIYVNGDKIYVIGDLSSMSDYALCIDEAILRGFELVYVSP